MDRLHSLSVIDLGRLGYREAYARQTAWLERVIAGRPERDEPDAPHAGEHPSPALGAVLLLEHDPVITVSQRPSAAGNVLAPGSELLAAGVALEATDRGGDVTYHGPGQLVVYPILDLNAFGLRLHDYMRLLEACVIDTCAGFGVAAERDPLPDRATGVWVARPGEAPAKIAAMGVRVRRWVSMHGLALNVTTNLDHFRLIVPCGLPNRPVTSLGRLLGESCPPMPAVKQALAASLRDRLARALESAQARRGQTGGATG